MKFTRNNTGSTKGAGELAKNPTVVNRVRNLALATLLAAGIVGGPYATAQAAGAVSSASKGNDSDSVIKNKAESESMFKDETVYVFKKANGENKNITVSDWLKNGDGNKTLDDVSSLSNITNTEGNQAFTSGNGNSLTWAADGSDIYYQGSATKQLPIDVTVTYWLDGKKVTPEELAGKSGEVKIRYDYKNRSKVTENGYTVYTPFVAMTAVMLNNDNMKNIKVTNAKMVNDGDHTSIVGYAMPGLNDSLKVDSSKVDFPEYVEITGTATNFKMGTAATYVTSDLFDTIDTNGMSANEVGDKLNQMQEAMDKLISGSNKLSDGLLKLSDGGDKLSNGLNRAKDGTDKLDNAGGRVLNGLEQLRNGTSKSTGLVDALSAIGTKSDTAADGTLLGGTNALGAGINTFGTVLRGSLQQAANAALQLANGASAIQSGVMQINLGAKQIRGGLILLGQGLDTAVASLGDESDDDTLIGGAHALSEGLHGAVTSIDSLTADDGPLAQTLTQVAGDLTDAGTQLQTAGGALQGSDGIGTDLTNSGTSLQSAAGTLQGLAQDPSLTIDQRQQVASALQDIAAAGTSTTDAGSKLQGVGTAIGTAGNDISDAGTLLTGLQQTLTTNIATLRTGLNDAAEGADRLEAGLTQLKGDADKGTGLAYAAASVGKATDSYSHGEKTLLGGINDIVAATDDGSALKNGVDAMQAGSQQLADGLNVNVGADSPLNKGLKSLSGGVDQVSNGLVTLRNGGTAPDGRKSSGIQGAVDALGTTTTKNTLIFGANSIVGGLGKLSKASAEAADGAAKLAKNLQKAHNGSEDLSDGLKTFDDQAIKKLLDAYNKNLKGLGDRVDAIVSAGKDYKNYSGISKNMDGQVRFVIEFDGINDSNENNSADNAANTDNNA